MAEDPENKDEEKLEFDAAGEAIAYISMDQARVLAMEHARETPGTYGRRFSNVAMAFQVVEDAETEDHYMVTLSFRPQGEFAGTPGQEQFFIRKEGAVAHRQVLSLPRPEGGRRLPLVLIFAGLALVVIAAIVGAWFVSGDLGSGGNSEIPAVLVPTATPPATPASTIPTATVVPLIAVAPTQAPIIVQREVVGTATPGPTPTPTLEPTHLPTATPVPTLRPFFPTPSPTSTATPLPVPTVTPAPRPAFVPTPVSKSLGYFGLGSTMDEVLAVQGTPTGIFGATWSYGLSTVKFDTSDKVVGWSDSSGNLKLR